MESDKILIDRSNLGHMVASALRYALPRRSYIVGITQQFIREHWQEEWLQEFNHCIIRDIEKYIEYADPDNFLLDSWKDLLKYLKENKTPES